MGASVKKVLADTGVSPDDVAGICADTTCCTVVALDDAGNALCPCILWMDMRAADQTKQVGKTLEGEQGVGVLRSERNEMDDNSVQHATSSPSSSRRRSLSLVCVPNPPISHDASPGESTIEFPIPHEYSPTPILLRRMPVIPRPCRRVLISITEKLVTGRATS